jgi:hypothetical protein
VSSTLQILPRLKSSCQLESSSPLVQSWPCWRSAWVSGSPGLVACLTCHRRVALGSLVVSVRLKVLLDCRRSHRDWHRLLQLLDVLRSGGVWPIKECRSLTRFCHLSRDRRSWAGCIRSSALAGVSTVGLSIGLVEVILCLAVLAGVCDGDHHRMLQHRRGGEAKVTQSGKRIENWPLNCNSISLALGAVSFKRGTCARSGQVPVPMFARVSQSASECPERGRMPSRLAIKLKKGIFGNLIETNSWILAIPCTLKKP